MRTPLPPRREAITSSLIYRGKRWHYSIGMDHKQRPKEVFINAPGPSGSGQALLVQDACILLSLMLQSGWTPDQIRERMGMDPSLSEGKEQRASILGAVLDDMTQEGVGK